jgi:2-polyprenyl-6-methoxyphenol hydroxylase-like FAD-dependent oxidoreductase
VTLLGDAIHSMTPYRGIGANVALKDAALLARAIVTAERGERSLIDSVEAYEAEMRRYGFAAVETSLHAMRQFTQENRIALAASRVFFRLVDRLAPVKRWMFRRMRED